MNSEAKGIIEPIDGWKKNTWYLVNLKCSSNNPTHRALYYCGFLDEKGRPAGYSGLVPMNGPDNEGQPRIYYMKVLKEIDLSWPESL